jgi:hypothetical protein
MNPLAPTPNDPGTPKGKTFRHRNLLVIATGMEIAIQVVKQWPVLFHE